MKEPDYKQALIRQEHAIVDECLVTDRPRMEAFGYDWPPPAPQPEEIRLEFLPEVFGPSKRHANKPENLWPALWGIFLFAAAVIFFKWLKG